jgi:heptosyltransferase-2
LHESGYPAGRPGADKAIKEMKILFITLSNIGDVLLTLPAFDYLRMSFPEAEITVIVGSRPKEIFQDNPGIKKVIVYDKHARAGEKLGLFIELLKERFDLVADLRNSLLGAILPVRYKISPFLSIPKSIKHMQARHLYKVQSIKFKTANDVLLGFRKNGLYLSPKDHEYAETILKENGIKDWVKLIVISPGARSHIKRWGRERFAELSNQFLEDKSARIILVGDQADQGVASYISDSSGGRVLNLVGKTTISELGALLKKASLLITNDSAVLHLGSYLDLAVLALFGPTNELKYGPWSERSAVVKRQIVCRPCEEAQCRFMSLECLSLIRSGDVYRRAQNILLNSPGILLSSCKDDFRRILIVRTDRIGDVLLSTPAVKALRDNYPHAYIAMMVSPYAKEIVEDNPYLDEVILCDNKTWFSSIWFAIKLRKKKFDLALVLHPTNRVHLITFFAGIARRVGFNRKLSFLLTNRIDHNKQLGEKHELEYSLDPLRYLGIEPQDKNLYMPIKPEAEAWVEELFQREGIKDADRLLAIHPAASCPSKIWMSSGFAEVADKLAQKYGLKVLLVAGPKDIKIVEELSSALKCQALNLAGKTSLSQLASLLKRVSLFISCDSGPVHIASALGVPVIAIFGRNQKGLSPLRWGPLGLKSRVLHKEVGCIKCLAHNCKKEFACLKAISAEDVIKAADSILLN